MTLDQRRLDLKILARGLGAARLSFGKPVLLRETLGVEPGLVTPFAVINDRESRVSVVLDKAMMARDLLNYHPLENHATTAITPRGLKAFLDSCGLGAALFDFDAHGEPQPACQ